ncbi:Group 1 truncated hemoglobin LI637 [Picochlorum sp. SENEW3]|nr:Group 1 truncated hemoglobin LI637 [Picochlorum sp. SENEW3]WPT18552.1 Group 1 truncated hemoglobin LI637 [Picochlorum sp. SENEW3]
MPSLIDKIGGPEAAMGVLIPAVELFYKKLLSDDEVSGYFDGVDTEKIKKKQVEFLAYVFGGPAEYTGKDIAEAHKKLIDERGLNEYHFDVVAGHFHDTLVELECPSEIVEEADAILLTSRPIFERKPPEDDPLGRALAEIERIRNEQEHDIDKLTHSLERVFEKSSEEDMEIIRSGLRMRGSGIVEFLDEFRHQHLPNKTDA